MSCARRRYPSDLNDLQWKHIKPLVSPARSARGRRRRISIRRLLNAVFYINQTGCAWRHLPKTYPEWETVYWYYSKWVANGFLRKVHDALVRMVRVFEKRTPTPTVLIIDSQSIKCRFGSDRGLDAFKKVRGRKRNIIVDTLGFIHGLLVDSALIKDHISGYRLLDGPQAPAPLDQPLTAFLADGGYRPFDFQCAVEDRYQIWPTLRMSVSKKNNRDTKVIYESNLKPQRWIVERTFAWLNNYRRLSHDYERTAKSSEGMIYLAMMQLMLRRLTRPRPYKRWK